jgi:hypothetical protein
LPPLIGDLNKHKKFFFSFGVTEAYLEKIANSEWSYVALATACYKLASPARYTVTVGGSTLAIKYLKVSSFLWIDVFIVTASELGPMSYVCRTILALLVYLI